MICVFMRFFACNSLVSFAVSNKYPVQKSNITIQSCLPILYQIQRAKIKAIVELNSCLHEIYFLFWAKILYRFSHIFNTLSHKYPNCGKFKEQKSKKQ